MSDCIDIKIYCKKQLDYNKYIINKGWHMQARNADEWRKRWDLTADVDSLSLMTRCRRVSLVYELLLWLTVGWSWLANLTTIMAGPIKRPSSSTITSLHNITGSVASCYKSHRLPISLRPPNYVVLYTTIMRRFKVRPFLRWNYFFNCRPVTSSFSDDPLTQFIAKPFLQCK